jgi:hypothetical protein
MGMTKAPKEVNPPYGYNREQWFHGVTRRDARNSYGTLGLLHEGSSNWLINLHETHSFPLRHRHRHLRTGEVSCQILRAQWSINFVACGGVVTSVQDNPCPPHRHNIPFSYQTSRFRGFANLTRTKYKEYIIVIPFHHPIEG